MILETIVPAVVANVVLALAAVKKEAVDWSGAAMGFVIGVGIFVGAGFTGWVALGAFFVGSSLVSRLGAQRKQQVQAIHEKSDRRDWQQAFANGGPAAVAAVLYRWSGDPRWLVAFLATLAAANADTWAGELGVLSNRPPVGILTLRPLPAGTSGGVSAVGTAAALVGAVVIAAVGLPLFVPLVPTIGWPGGLNRLAIVVAAGFGGSLLDSVLGATVQAQYRRPDGSITEQRRAGALVRGLRAIDNDVVNLLSTAAAGAVAFWAA